MSRIDIHIRLDDDETVVSSVDLDGNFQELAEILGIAMHETKEDTLAPLLASALAHLMYEQGRISFEELEDTLACIDDMVMDVVEMYWTRQ